MRAGLVLVLAVCSLILAPVAVSADDEPRWFDWIEYGNNGRPFVWAKYLATRDTPIVDWTGELIGASWRANWVRVAKYILYCAPYDDDPLTNPFSPLESVEKARQAWYGCITLEGHVPDNGGPAKFGEVNWSWDRWDYVLATIFGKTAGFISEQEYAESVLWDEFSGPSKSSETKDGKEYWLPDDWKHVHIGGSDLLSLVRQDLAKPFTSFQEAKKKLWYNPMFRAAVRLAYWVATHIPYAGVANWPAEVLGFPSLDYYDCVSCCYYHGPAAVLLYPNEGWNCEDHAVLAVALYRAAGIPGYVVGGLLDGKGHAWTAVFVYDPNSEDEKKWHEIFIDPVGPKAHERTHDPYCDYEYEFIRWYRGRHPYGYDGRFPLAAELEDERILAGVNPWYWWRRVAAFNGRGGWYASSGRINSEWDALKREWRTITVRPAPSKKSASIWPVIALTLLLIASRRPSS